MTWPSTRVAELLGIRYPIVQAPMAGATTAELVAAVSEAGALGSIGGTTMPPEGLRAEIRRVRELTDRPFAVNLFAPHERPEPAPDVVAAVDAVLAPYRRQLGLPDPDRSGAVVPPDPFEAQLAVVVAERVPVFSFTFGLAPVDDVRASGALIMGTATTTTEAALLEQHGVDVVVAQGSEAGGHRGTFTGPFAEALIGTIALVPQVVDRVAVPVIAAGGVADGRAIAAALMLGAEGVQPGTAFLTCPESGVPDGYRETLLGAAETATAITSAYTGRPARAIRTQLIADLENAGVEFAPYPAEAHLLADLRMGAIEFDRADLLFLLAGQAAGLTRSLPAGELVETLVDEVAGLLGG